MSTIKPQVGMGVTGVIYTDSQALTITRISPTGKTFWAKLDKATLKPDWKPIIMSGGFAGHCVNNHEQDYDYEPCADGQEICFRLSLSGKWVCRKKYRHVILGVRRTFNDYNF